MEANQKAASLLCYCYVMGPERPGLASKIRQRAEAVRSIDWIDLQTCQSVERMGRH